MGRIKAMILAAIVLSCGLLAAPDCDATIYKYVDKDGLINFADDLQAIPVQYRAQAVIVSGEAKEPEVKRPDNAVAPKTQTGVQEQASPAPDVPGTKTVTEPDNKSTFGKRAIFSAMVVVSALFGFVILGIIDSDHKKSIKIVRVVILWGVSVFLLYSHAMDVVNFFRSTVKSVTDARQAAEEKGKKAARAMKELNTLAEQAEKTNSADHSNVDPERKE